ncbi:hypothetical protein EV215_1963 [Hypnocyclicus thermotrophus]|uniref:Uncharacterized protein n=1 Tax=Hypnocyclicus thermotrophus TaxID=1627895 RepID=A0AA46DX07_9FUSO|nr:hypothetical protein [Hypnocyclicus thermotrophus]TDT67409.1 hypothetical protein EV215_1963 [Hypnocyclicus thermotrophus]
MKKLTILFLFLIISILTFTNKLDDYKVFSTNNFEIFYPKDYEYKAIKVAYFLEKYRNNTINFVGKENNEKIKIIINDAGTYSNGYANSLDNSITIYANTPSTTTEFGYMNDWERLVSVHEFTHIAQINNMDNNYTILNKFNSYIKPNMFVPNWIIEGIAVINESKIDRFDGRLNTGYFDALINAKVNYNDFPNLLEMNYYHDSFPSGQYYLYGSKFLDFLEKKYDSKTLTSFFDKQGKNYFATSFGIFFPMFGIDNSAKKSFGKPFKDLYNEWKLYEYKNAQKYKLNKNNILINTKESDNYFSLNPYKKKIFYFKREKISNEPFDYQNRYFLIEYDTITKKENILIKLNSAPTTQMEIYNNKIYFSTNEISKNYKNFENNSIGYNKQLFSYDLNNNKLKKLYKGNFRDFTIYNNKILLSKEKKGSYGSEIIDINNKLIFSTNRFIDEILIYNNKFYLVNKKEFGSYNISMLDIKNNKLIDIINSPWHETNIKIFNNFLYYTSNKNSKINSYRYNLKNKSIEILSNNLYSAEGIILDDFLYYIALTNNGKIINKINFIPDNNKSKNTIKYFENKKEISVLNNINIYKKNKNINIENKKYLLKPYYNTLGNLELGTQDALGINKFYFKSNYSFDYIKAIYENNYFNSTKIYLSKIIDDDNSLIFTLNYNLYKNLNNFINNITLVYITDFSSNILGDTISLNKNKYDLTLKNYFNITNYGNKNTINLNIKNKYFTNKLYLNHYYNYNITNYFRGYGKINIETNKNNNYFNSLDNVFKIFKIRNGLWNPNIFIGDIYANLFFDNLLLNNNSYYSYGFELISELGMANSLLLAPKIGWAKNNDNEKEIYFGFYGEL